MRVMPSKFDWGACRMGESLIRKQYCMPTGDTCPDAHLQRWRDMLPDELCTKPVGSPGGKKRKGPANDRSPGKKSKVDVEYASNSA